MLKGVQSAGTCPPRLRRCPPSLVGFLARIWAWWFAFGSLMKLTADLEAPRRKTPTFKKPPAPRFGGQRRAQRGAGGLFTRSARPATRAPPVSGGSAKRGGLVPALCKTSNKKPPQGAAPKARGACPRFLLNPQQVSPAQNTNLAAEQKEAAGTFCCEVADDCFRSTKCAGGFFLRATVGGSQFRQGSWRRRRWRRW